MDFRREKYYIIIVQYGCAARIVRVCFYTARIVRVCRCGGSVGLVLDFRRESDMVRCIQQIIALESCAARIVRVLTTLPELLGLDLCSSDLLGSD